MCLPLSYSFRWALGWLWDQKEVTVVLSGMNSMEMLRENVETASAIQPGSYTPEDQDMLKKVLESINSNMKVGCTACRYCMPCPKGVDIPSTFSAYNLCASEGKASGRWAYLMCTAMRPEPTSASQCIGCGKCEAHCPQHLPIRQELKNAANLLETPYYKIAKLGVKLLKLY